METSVTFTIPRTDRSIAEMLSGMPRAFKEEAQKGFRILGGIGVTDHPAILSSVMTALENKSAPPESLEQKLRLPRGDIGALFAASMLAASLLAEGATPEEFLVAATRVELIRPEIQAKVRSFLDNIVADRVEVKKALRRASLPSQVLPFLIRCKTWIIGMADANE